MNKISYNYYWLYINCFWWSIFYNSIFRNSAKKQNNFVTTKVTDENINKLRACQLKVVQNNYHIESLSNGYEIGKFLHLISFLAMKIQSFANKANFNFSDLKTMQSSKEDLRTIMNHRR